MKKLLLTAGIMFISISAVFAQTEQNRKNTSQPDSIKTGRHIHEEDKPKMQENKTRQDTTRANELEKDMKPVNPAKEPEKPAQHGDKKY